MSNVTEHHIVIKADIGLTLEETQMALYNMLQAGSLNVDGKKMKESYPNIRKGPIEIITDPDPLLFGKITI